MDESSPETRIREAIDTWLKATAFGDLDKILDLMSDEVVFLLPGRPPMEGKEEFASAFRAMGPRSKIEGTSDIREILVSGDLGYVWTQLSLVITTGQDSEPMHRAGSTLSVFRKEADGRWKLFRDANLLTQI